MFEIEVTEPRFSECASCSGQTTIITRFVFKNDRPFALYHATFSAGHSENGVMAAIGFDENWELVESPTRVAFACQLVQTKEERGVSVTDWAESPWNNSKVIGRKLNRADALTHPLIDELFHSSDHVFAEDPAIREFFSAGTIH